MELIFAVPVLLVFIFAVLDLTMLMQTRSTMDTAATAAVRYVEDRPELFFEKNGVAQAGGGYGDTTGTWATNPVKLTGNDSEALSAYLDEAFGSDLFGSGAASARLELAGDMRTSTYDHHFYADAPETDDDLDNPAVRAGCKLAYQPFKVTVEYPVDYKTPVGDAIAAAAGTRRASSSQAGSADLTDGASW